MGLNPLPFQVGGGPTATAKAYRVTRNAVGVGGSAQNDLGIEGLWRRCRAKGLAAATSSYRRAILQLDPHLATDFLPYYERILGEVPAPGDAPATRADVVGEEWTQRLDAALPAIADELARIDGRLTLLTKDQDHVGTAQFGRAFGAHLPSLEGPAFGGPGYALYPAWSTNFTVHVRFAVAHDGPYTESEGRVVERVRAYLRDVLPSWVDFRISVGTWHLGHTPIDMGALG
jgi:hypothetical protein